MLARWSRGCTWQKGQTFHPFVGKGIDPSLYTFFYYLRLILSFLAWLYLSRGGNKFISFLVLVSLVLPALSLLPDMDFSTSSGTFVCSLRSVMYWLAVKMGRRRYFVAFYIAKINKFISSAICIVDGRSTFHTFCENYIVTNFRNWWIYIVFWQQNKILFRPYLIEKLSKKCILKNRKPLKKNERCQSVQSWALEVLWNFFNKNILFFAPLGTNGLKCGTIVSAKINHFHYQSNNWQSI